MSTDFQQTSVFCQTAMQMADPGACWEFFPALVTFTGKYGETVKKTMITGIFCNIFCKQRLNRKIHK